MFKFTIKTQPCIDISILLWQRISILLDHLQASIQRYEVQSVHILYCGIPYYLQGVHKISLKRKKLYILNEAKKYEMVVTLTLLTWRIW